MQYSTHRSNTDTGFSNRSAGFSLIEMLLALGLGLIVTAGVVQLFVGNNQTYSLLTGQSRLQESARYTMEFITQSARSSGYFGCDPDNDKVQLDTLQRAAQAVGRTLRVELV